MNAGSQYGRDVGAERINRHDFGVLIEKEGVHGLTTRTIAREANCQYCSDQLLFQQQAKAHRSNAASLH